MSKLDHEWVSIQTAIDTCSVCLSEELFNATGYPPIRPGSPNNTGRVLFLSEAPPPTGGFWRLNHSDDLRSSLMSLLDIQSEPPREAVDAFIEKGFFLLQSLKWPLVKTFNHLGPKQQRQLIEHSAQEHLRIEIDALRPKAILAMGKAAWLSCRFLSGQWNNEVSTQFEQSLGEMRLVTVRGNETKWMATYLIINQNLRLPERAKAISVHLKKFIGEVARSQA